MDVPLLEMLKDPESPAGVMDLVYGLFVLYGLLRGLFRGFAKETASVLGSLITLWGSWKFYRPVSRRLLNNNLLDNEMASQVLAYILLVFLLLVAWRLITALLSKLLTVTLPVQLHRPGGALMGALKSLALLTILLIAAQLSGHEFLQKHLIEQSALGRRVCAAVPLDLDPPSPPDSR